LIAGCGRANKPVVLNPDQEAILQVGRAYMEASQALKKPPSGMKVLKPYLKKYGDPDKLLVSPSDGQPYQINWGVMPSHTPKSLRQNPFLVYEQTGKGGKRYAVDFRLNVRHVTDKEFAKLQGSN
jgi:hypothetical protein